MINSYLYMLYFIYPLITSAINFWQSFANNLYINIYMLIICHHFFHIFGVWWNSNWVETMNTEFDIDDNLILNLFDMVLLNCIESIANVVLTIKKIYELVVKNWSCRITFLLLEVSKFFTRQPKYHSIHILNISASKEMDSTTNPVRKIRST